MLLKENSSYSSSSVKIIILSLFNLPLIYSTYVSHPWSFWSYIITLRSISQTFMTFVFLISNYPIYLWYVLIVHCFNVFKKLPLEQHIALTSTDLNVKCLSLVKRKLDKWFKYYFYLKYIRIIMLYHLFHDRQLLSITKYID